MAKLDKGLDVFNAVVGLLKSRRGFKQAKKFGEKTLTAGRVPDIGTTGNFPQGGLSAPTGDLANSVRQVTGFRLDPKATLTRQQTDNILAQLREKDPQAAQDFANFVQQQSGGTPTNPTVPDLVGVFEKDLTGLRAAEKGNFERQLGAISQLGQDLDKGIAGQKKALAGREAAILGNLSRSLKRSSADLRLATATQFLPLAVMKRLRDDSLAKFSDTTAAEQNMVVGALNARHNQEEGDLRARLQGQGMNPEFIEAQVQDLRSTQSQQVDTTLTDIRVKNNRLHQELDLATQQNVGFAVQTAATGTAQLAGISARLTETSTRLIRDTQMQLLTADLSIREMELRGKADIANMMRSTKEIFIPESGVWEAAFGLNQGMQDQERNADIQAFAIGQGAFDSLLNASSQFSASRQNQKSIDTQQKSNQNAALFGGIGAGLSGVGSIFTGVGAIGQGFGGGGGGGAPPAPDIGPDPGS